MIRPDQLTLWMLFACCMSSLAAEEKEFRGQDAQRVAAWLRISQQHASDYRLEPSDRPEAPFKLLPKPVFRHSQPVRGDDIGAVYLWVDERGLPGALGTVFSFSINEQGKRWVAHEFHSLAATPLVARWRDGIPWSPAEAGVCWKEVPEAPVAADESPARLSQMRQIGRRFSANSEDVNNSRWELRLVTQPIYQYQVKSDDILGGGVFLFCQGTDPEVVLLLEARKTAAGAKWHYACAAFSDYGLSVRLDDSEVWSQEKRIRPTKTSIHWWRADMEVKQLTPEEEAELAAQAR